MHGYGFMLIPSRGLLSQPAVNDPFPFKLYRGGADDGTSYVGGTQIAQSASMRSLWQNDFIHSGDCIKVAPGTYAPTASNHPGVGELPVQVADLTIEWLVFGQRPVIDYSRAGFGDSFFIEMDASCTALRVRGLDVRGSYDSQDNQRCFIYGLSGYPNLGSFADVAFTLTVEYCAMREWTFGMQISRNWNGVLNFKSNLVEAGRGGGLLPHGLYIHSIAQCNARGNLFRRLVGTQADAGHLFKCRARTAVIEANFFDGRNQGCARAFDYSNGGTLTFDGNTVFLGAADTPSDSNQLISFAPEQTSTNSGWRPNEGRTHSISAGQNTLVHDQSTGQPLIKFFTPQAGALLSSGTARGSTTNTIQLSVSEPAVAIGSLIQLRVFLGLWHTVTAWDDTTKTATISDTWDDTIVADVTGYNVFDAPTAPTITKTVRNNVAAAQVNSAVNGAQGLVATFPDNSQVSVSDIDASTGALLIADIAGSPSVNDAPYKFAAVFQTPTSRTDTLRGAVPNSWTPPYSLPSVGQTLNIATNSPDLVKPAALTASEWMYACFNAYGGGAFVEDYSQGGAFVIADSGGHTAPENIGALIVDLADATFKRLDPQGGSYKGAPGYAVSETGGSPHYEITGSGGVPAPAHPYTMLLGIPSSLGGGSKGSVLYPTRVFVCQEFASSTTAHQMSLTTGVWSRRSTNQSTRARQASAVLDVARQKCWVLLEGQNGFQSILYYDLATEQFVLTANSTFAPDDAASGAVFMHAGLIIRHGTNSKLFYYDPDDNASGIVQLTVSGMPALDPWTIPWVYFPTTGKFYKSTDSGGTTMYRLTPPASSPKTNTWVVDTVTVSPSLPAATSTGGGPVGYHNRLFYVPAIQRLAWVPGGEGSGIHLVYPS